MKSVSSEFLQEIEKPSWFPIRKCFMLDNVGVEVDITDKVVRFDRILWQIEQSYRINEFRGSNCRIDLNSKNGEFDIDNATNFFVTTLNRVQDGFNVPILIKCGYQLPNGTDELITMFKGLILDINVSTDDDIVSIDAQCVSKILREASTDDLGDQWTDEQVYGGDVHCYLDGTIGTTDIEIIVQNTPTGDFPGGFPPGGYLKIDNEKIWYSQITVNSFDGCVRGMFGTDIETHADNTLVEILLFNGEVTNDKKFQFLNFPLCRKSITAISSSDGNIVLIEERALLGVAGVDGNTTGWIDYNNGILELADPSTDATSLVATFKSQYKSLSYHGLVKRCLIENNFDTSLVEDAIIYDYLARAVPTTYGQITHAYDSGTPTLLQINASINALCIGEDDLLYLGVENHIIQWDNMQFNLIDSLPSATDTIVRLASHSNGKFYGVYGDKFAYGNKTVFEYNSGFTDIATVAEYVDPRPVFGYYGGQWRNFSIDETNSIIWFLYDDGATRGIAKVNFDGTGLTKYSRPAKISAGPWLLAQYMDFVDVGTTIEFFYADSVSGDLIYDTLTKSTGLWAANGTIAMPYTDLAPVDVIYHDTEDRIYLNTVATYGYLISVPKGSNSKTTVLTYDWYAIGSRGRICGFVLYQNYIWGIKGGENARGSEAGTAGDSATGRLYRIQNNTAEDLGNMAEYPDFAGFVRGSSAVMCSRVSDNALFFVSTDYNMQDNPEYGYQLYRYSPQLATILGDINLNGRNVWDVLSELAIICNYEVGVSGEGKVFWRRRQAGITYLAGNHNDSVTTINTDGTGMSDFETAGMIQLDTEVISHTGKTATSFTGCIRGDKSSTATTHSDGVTIFEIHQVLQNLSDEKNLKFAQKIPNWDEIYNYIEVPYGDLTCYFNYELAGETWADCSENKYGRRAMTLSNQFLTNGNAYIAMGIGWRYYDHYNLRASLLEIETKWQPQLDLGDHVVVNQPTRTGLDYTLSRIHRIELSMKDFSTRLLARLKIGKYNKYLPVIP